MEIELYEETSIKYNKDSHLFSIASPWLKGKIKIPNGTIVNTESNGNFVEILNNDAIFKHKSRWPFCYVKPRKELLETNAIIKRGAKKSKELETPKSLLNALSANTLNNTFWKKHKKNWMWHVNNVLSKSMIKEGVYDPYSAFTHIRRYRNISKNSELADRLSHFMNTILKDDEPRFFGVISTLLTQSYYITSQCQSALKPALNSFTEAYIEIKSFIEEEEGHEKLVDESIQKIPKKYIKHHQVFPEAIMAMKLLKQAAQYHPLAFSCLVSHFEEPSSFSSDPLSDLISKSSIPEIAIGITKHFKINKQGNHCHVGVQFVDCMNACSEEDIVTACRYAELLKLLFDAFAYRILLIWK